MNQNASITETILAPLKELQTLSQNLFLSLGPPNTNPPPAPSAADLLACDASIAASLEKARIHQIKQRKIERLKQEILGLDSRLVEIWKELEAGQRELAQIVDEGDQRTAAMDKAMAAAVPYTDLLAYASNLSSFTAAPPESVEANLIAGQPSLFHPPFPNEEKMRRGRLNAELPLGIVGETHSIGHEPSQSPPPTVIPQGAPASRVVHQFSAPQSQPAQGLDFGLDLNPDE